MSNYHTYSERSTGEEFDPDATYECECGAALCPHFDGMGEGGCSNAACELACATCCPTPIAAVAAAAHGFFDKMIATVDRVLSKVEILR